MRDRYETAEYRYLGDLSACPRPLAVMMTCAACSVRWLGCADVYECPECGEGAPPWFPADVDTVIR